MIARSPDKFTIYKDDEWGDWNVMHPFGGWTQGGYRTFKSAVAHMDATIFAYEDAIVAGVFDDWAGLHVGAGVTEDE